MKGHVKYFGMVAEKTKCSKEDIVFEKSETPINLRAFFENKYPFLLELNYKIAINQLFSDTIVYSENARVEIALLPPFAGG
ncbi:MAG: MoaD/ThiS family protein [Bacteroidia bacterium]